MLLYRGVSPLWRYHYYMCIYSPFEVMYMLCCSLPAAETASSIPGNGLVASTVLVAASVALDRYVHVCSCHYNYNLPHYIVQHITC